MQQRYPLFHKPFEGFVKKRGDLTVSTRRTPEASSDIKGLANGVLPMLASGMGPVLARRMGPMLASGMGPVLASRMGPVLAGGMEPVQASRMGPVLASRIIDSHFLLRERRSL